MKVFVELNDRVAEVEAESVSQLRVETVKRLSVDITQFELRSGGVLVDDGCALQPGQLVHLVPRGSPVSRDAQNNTNTQNTQNSTSSALT